MSASRPERRIEAGRFIRLEPLTEAHLPALWRALGRAEVFAGGFGGGPAGLPADEGAFGEWMLRRFPHREGNCYAVRLAAGPDAGSIVGTSSLAEFALEREHAHLGWTGYDPRVWGTAVNPETKLLLLGLAFDHGFGRVRLQADAVNARSRAAIERLGATFEGITRRDVRRADGSWRDTAVYSILVDEWPEVRSRLVARLESAAAPALMPAEG